MEGLIAGEDEVAGGRSVVGTGAGLIEVVGHVGGVCLGAFAVHLLHGLGDPEVQALAPREGEAADQCLADELVGEAEAGLDGVIGGGCRKIIRGNDQIGTLSLVDGIEEAISAELSEGLKHLEAEVAADDRCVGKRGTAVLAHALEAPANDKTDAFRHVELADLKVRPPAPLCVEEPSLLREVLEDFFHKEGVAFGLTVDRLDERGRRRLGGESAQHRLDSGFRKWLESDTVGEALPDERLEGLGEGTRCVELDVAIRCDGEDGHLVLMLGDVL